MDLQICFTILSYQDNTTLYRDNYLYELFQQEKQKFNRQYKNQDEEYYRFQIFKVNFQEVQDLNKKNNYKGTSYSLNDFFDMSNNEYESLFDAKYFDKSQINLQPSSQILDLEDYHSDYFINKETKKNYLNHIFNENKIDPIRLILKSRQNNIDQQQYQLRYEDIYLNNNFSQRTLFDQEREEQCIGEYLSEHFQLQKRPFNVSYRRLQSIQETKEDENEQTVDVQQDQEKNLIQKNNKQQENKQTDIQQKESNNNQEENKEKEKKSEEEIQQNKRKKKRKIDLVNRLYFSQRKYEKINPKIKNPFDKYSNTYANYEDYNIDVETSESDDKQNEVNESNDKQEEINQSNDKQNEVNESNDKQEETILIDGIKVPTYLNWNKDGRLDYVKNQRDCNACYAFGAISALESHQILYHNNDQKYSEQEVVDCNSYNSSCYGGQPYMVFDYIEKNGIHEEKNYQYVSIKSRCKQSRLRQQKIYNLLKGYLFIRQGMKNLILATTVAPTVAISYASKEFKFYQDGIYYGEECDGTRDPNHTSLVYGYDLTAEIPYLMLKTNWGNYWGIQGHYKLAIGELTDDNYGPCLYANTPFNVMPIVQLIINIIQLQKRSF